VTRGDRPVEIAIRGLGQVFGAGAAAVTALTGIDLEIEAGEFVCLLGPSGCGKSTLLNAIAGFVAPSSGTVTVRGQSVAGPGPDRGMVFQEFALFPWMSVARNIAFGLEIRGAGRTEIARKVDELLALLGLEEFRDRFPKDLSGGMRQRVAIARILALDPPIMLMDEPFGALDALTRRGLEDELLRLWQATGKTIVFVTHSIEEALALGSRVVVMTYRPGTIKRDIAIPLPRPRDRANAGFAALLRELDDLVMAEQHRRAAAEQSGASA
jgi:NitT/TauT family transport system ATP-binding protein